jgi:hypothetical protein
MKDPRRPDEHRGMSVVAARVHDAIDRARVVEPGVFSHRECVHIRPQQHGRTRTATLQHRSHRTEGITGPDGQIEAPERIEHPLLRACAFEVPRAHRFSNQRQHARERAMQAINVGRAEPGTALPLEVPSPFDPLSVSFVVPILPKRDPRKPPTMRWRQSGHDERVGRGVWARPSP